MAALGLTVGILLLLSLVGLAVLALVDSIEGIDRVLLAPATGLAALVIATYVLDRLLPIGTFGPLFCSALVVGAGATVLARPPKLNPRDATPYVAVLVVALVFAAMPMFNLGFRWLGNANPDFGYYVLTAQRVFHSTFDKVPDIKRMLAGTDYGPISHALGFAPGGELIVALVRSVTGLRGDQALMPTIVAFHLSMITSAGAMTRRTSAGDRAAIATCAILAVSPLAVYSIFQQFLGQPAGLAFVCAVIALLFNWGAAYPAADGRRTWLAAMLAVALFLTYPEILTFVVASFLAGALISRGKERFDRRRFLLICLTTGSAFFVVLNTNSARAIALVSGELFSGVAFSKTNVIFPFFLSARALASIWGLARFDARPSTLVALATALGAVLLVATVVWAMREARNRIGPAVTLLVFVVVGVLFYLSKTAFGLFRLAMYVQPFLIATFCVGWFKRGRPSISRVVAIAALGVLMLPTTFAYINASRQSVNLAPGVTGDVIDRFEAAIRGKTRVVSGTDQFLSAELEAQLAGKTRILFISQDFFTPGLHERQLAGTSSWIYSNLQSLKAGLGAASRVWQKQRFDFGKSVGQASFLWNERAESWLQSDHCWFAIPDAEETFLNRSSTRAARGSANVEPCARLENVLVFIHSSRGQPATFNTDPRIPFAFYPLEPDFAFPGHTVTGAGRYLLLRVLSPTDRTRLVVDMTTSPLPSDAKRLPPVSVVGADRYLLGFVGSGSGRTISPVVEPQKIHGALYLGIDMGRNGTPLDTRTITAFLRNISLVSEDDFKQLQAPAVVDKIPRDLGNPALQYSGVYEDGWLSGESRFVLSQPPGAKDFSFSGNVVGIAGAKPTTVTISIDGRTVQTSSLSSGPFQLKVALRDWKADRVVDVSFSPARVLPAPDGRAVGAFLKAIGFPTNG